MMGDIKKGRQEAEVNEGFTIWFTGLTGAGKTTIAKLVAQELRKRGKKVEILDGDEVRKYLSDGLGFTKEDRDRNVLRIGYVCKLLSRNGIVAIGAAVSPYRDTREKLKEELEDFVEIYVRCPLKVCEQRDYKGIYRAFREGKISRVSGLDDPYEEPESPDVILDTAQNTPEECLSTVMRTLEELGYVRPEVQEKGSYDDREKAIVEERLSHLGYI